MTAPLIAPVIPPRSRPAAGAGRPARPAGADGRGRGPGPPDVVYGIGRIDESGRVADRVMIAALGWRAGDRLTVTAEAGVMIARRDPGGMVTMPASPMS